MEVVTHLFPFVHVRGNVSDWLYLSFIRLAGWYLHERGKNVTEAI